MALAEICGFAGSKILNNKPFSTSAFEDEIMQASGNMVNNYQLAMPPYSNVRLSVHNSIQIFTVKLIFK